MEARNMLSVSGAHSQAESVSMWVSTEGRAAEQTVLDASSSVLLGQSHPDCRQKANQPESSPAPTTNSDDPSR